MKFKVLEIYDLEIFNENIFFNRITKSNAHYEIVLFCIICEIYNGFFKYHIFSETSIVILLIVIKILVIIK